MSSGRSRGSAQWDGTAGAAYPVSGYRGAGGPREAALSRAVSHNSTRSVPSGLRVSWMSGGGGQEREEEIDSTEELRV